MPLHADRLIEKNSIYLTNLNKSEKTVANTWYSGTGYGFYTVPYVRALAVGHYYYGMTDYKFTTTNQSPTWMSFYFQGGSLSFNRMNNPIAGNEYHYSGLTKLTKFGGSTGAVTSGTLYNGESSAINGVTSYCKNCMLVDVTELYAALRAKGIVSSDATMKTWCDNNITYHAPYEEFAVTIDDTSSKFVIQKGNVVANNIVECDGMVAYSASSTLASHTYFDEGIGVSVYNNAGGGTVTLTRVAASSQNSPFEGKHPYILQIKTNGEARPSAGGFIASHNAAANKIFIEKFVAKVPVGYTVRCAYNSQGTGSTVNFITPTAGTGEWEEYAVLYKCGTSGTFSSGGHIYIDGTNNTSVTWYVAYVNSCDITGKEYLKNYSVLENKMRIKDGDVFCREFDSVNLIPNGNGSKQQTSMLPANWSFDTEDKAGNAYASIVQGVGANAMGSYGGKFKVDPSKRYKISYWVKCKSDMTSYLSAVKFYAGNKELVHADVNYVSGTKTTLTKELKSGDTSMQVSKNTNWIDRSYAKIGFRTNTYSYSYNNLGASNSNGRDGLISGISGTNIVNFKVAYSGSTMPVNTCVVEAFDGGTYPYPVSKGSLPTNNTWKYVEGYIGTTTDSIWDGATTGTSWIGIPNDATDAYFTFNIYNNDGSVPIKYADLRIEPISQISSRLEEKIQINEVH